MAEITWLVQPNGCWLCNSHTRDRHGYPHCQRNNKQYRISRLMYEGDIPVNHIVRHTCDTPACINPDHLILGTHFDNAQDRVEKQKSPYGNRSGISPLTDEQVIAIYTDKTHSEKYLAHYYNIDRYTIKDIKKKRKWVSVIDAYISSMV